MKWTGPHHSWRHPTMSHSVTVQSISLHRCTITCFVCVFHTSNQSQSLTTALSPLFPLCISSMIVNFSRFTRHNSYMMTVEFSSSSVHTHTRTQCRYYRLLSQLINHILSISTSRLSAVANWAHLLLADKTILHDLFEQRVYIKNDQINAHYDS